MLYKISKNQLRKLIRENLGNELELQFQGEDEWGRKSYKGNDGKLYCEVEGEMDSCTDEGEPMYPINNNNFSKIDNNSGMMDEAKENAVKKPVKNAMEIYSMTDQPDTCPKCGSRTDFNQVSKRRQHHKCLNPKCKYEYYVE